MESLTCAPTSNPRQVKAPDGRLLEVPAGWVCLPPGDAGLTRRVKAAGPSYTVIEKVGRKSFSHGVWAPAANITAAKAALSVERSTPAYEKKRAADVQRREVAQTRYVEEFQVEVHEFLAFAPRFSELGRKLAHAVTAHATPVGSGTVARTKRIEIDRRAEAAVIAWMRHQTTAYDNMKVARVKGARRQVRRELATISRAILDLHRRDTPHAPSSCPLCRALSTSTPTSTLTSTPTPTPTRALTSWDVDPSLDLDFDL
jgi:hypothetical protein